MSLSPPSDGLTPVDDVAGRTVYRDEDRETYHMWWTDSDPEAVSTVLVLTVASVLETDPEELEALSTRVDPDALDTLFAHWGRHRIEDGTTSFRFAGCAVVCHASGELVIDPSADR
ncbi:hypothetical protein C491_03735 [Natronococcus amylolyticus DSM 10524]|uniref:Halobacterial output domain-containing protein n=1 Tax=Natronococcus amylolyticus DSM 10524 TaxID=1227497 RepID=L9XF74_9EURY|nr:HalOD1 output domain-containing protein [Natronococcus amylolyticus]ELY60375.1 hypothetical protein C491_03735 [Natronococcus amylolyticus DSM 10524]